MKSNFKIFITFLLLLFLFFTSTALADNSIGSAISGEPRALQIQESNTKDSDLYLSDSSQADIKNIINGNVFASVDTLNIDPNDNGGIIQGNLFTAAKSVNIKSDVTYSDTEKDDLGNPAISINKSSTISGNTYVVTDKFVLEPGCKIYGDLYICANEVNLSQFSAIYGNVFVVSNNLNVNAEIGGSLYATSKVFDMQYFAYISKDLHLSADSATLNGYVYRSSFIEANNITTNDKFVNKKDFNLSDAENLTFSGEIDGNATINAKNFSIKNKENDKDLICKINGNLSYSSNQEIQIPDGIVSSDVNYTKYVNTSSKTSLSDVWDFVLNMLTLLVCVYVIYLLISKLTPIYLDKLSNMTWKSLLKYFGIGLGFLILIPIITILLFISNVGSVLGIILLLIYIILILVDKSIFIIAFSKFIKDKNSNKSNMYLYMLAITAVLSLIKLIPYLGLIVSLLVDITGFGIIVKNLKSNKK